MAAQKPVFDGCTKNLLYASGCHRVRVYCVYAGIGVLKKGFLTRLRVVLVCSVVCTTINKPKKARFYIISKINQISNDFLYKLFSNRDDLTSNGGLAQCI